MVLAADDQGFAPACSHVPDPDRKSTRLNSSHLVISYAVFCLKKKKNNYKINVAAATKEGRKAGNQPLDVTALHRFESITRRREERNSCHIAYIYVVDDDGRDLVR